VTTCGRFGDNARLILRHAFIPPDNARLANLSGSLDEHLRTLAAAFDVKIQRRNESFRVEGARANAERAVGLLQQLYGRAVRPIGGDELELAILEAMADDGARAEAAGRNGAAAALPAATEASAGPDLRLRTRRSDLAARTPNQVAYLKNILGHDITFGIGPAGTGKTYLAVACAVDALERNAVQRIILTRPAVEAGERLGFLPGDLAQKVDPYLRPLYDALYELMGLDRVGKAFEKATLEVAPLAFMRAAPQPRVRHPRRGAEHDARADEDVPDADRLRLQGRGHRRRQPDRPAQGHGLGPGAGRAHPAPRRRHRHHPLHLRDVVRHPLVARIVEAYGRADKARDEERR
jgi:phosphate starvation-inducible PhoH-like protein